MGSQNAGPEVPPKNKKEQRRCQEKSDCQRSDVEGGCVRIIEGKKVRRDDPVEYFLLVGVGSTSSVPEGMMANEVPQNEEISGGAENGGRKGVRFAISRSGANK